MWGANSFVLPFSTTSEERHCCCDLSSTPFCSAEKLSQQKRETAFSKKIAPHQVATRMSFLRKKFRHQLIT
jgi:hypothetical protein